MKWLVSFALICAAASAPAAPPSAPLAIRQPTPAGACRYLDDCSFRRGDVSYISFEKMITRREMCAPAVSLFGIARKGERLDVVQKRLRSSGWINITAKKSGDHWLLIAGHPKENFRELTVTFDKRGEVYRVAEMANTA